MAHGSTRSLRRRLGAALMVTGLLAGLSGLVASPSLAAPGGGKSDIDFVAAGPGTYIQETGVGGEYGNRTISKANGVVNSLEGADFNCGDRVVYFARILGSASQVTNGVVDVTFNFATETTGHKADTPPVGFGEPVVSLHTTDSAWIDAETTAELDQDAVTFPGKLMRVPVSISGIEDGDNIIVRIVVTIVCAPGVDAKDNNGNLHAALDVPGTGSQTIPLKSAARIIDEPTLVAFLTIEKSANPQGGTEFDFEVADGDGDGIVWEPSLVDDGEPESTDYRDSMALDPGGYTITEVVPGGWSLTAVSCVDESNEAVGTVVLEEHTASLRLEDGDDVICTFTNEQHASLTIVKDARPDSSQAFDFTSEELVPDETFSLVDDGADSDKASQRFGGLAAGTYVVTENLPPTGWSLTAINCVTGTEPTFEGAETRLADRSVSVVLDPGDDVTCTFTNTRESGSPTGSLTIAKVVAGVPDAEVDDYTFVFDVTCGSTETTSSIVGEGTTVARSGLAVGTQCSVTETAIDRDGGELEGATWTTRVDGVVTDTATATIAAGTNTVTFTNTRALVEPAVVTTTTEPEPEPTTTTEPEPEPTSTTAAVLGVVEERELPRTGGDIGALLLLAGIAMLLGGLALAFERPLASQRRRRL